MKMEFNIQQRIILLGLLPRERIQGDLRTIRSLKAFRNDLIISEDEIKALNFKDKGNGRFSWDNEKDVPVEIEVNKEVYAKIVERLHELIQDKEVKEYHLEFFDRFEVDQPKEEDTQTSKHNPVNTVESIE